MTGWQRIKWHLMQIFIAFDQLLNAIIGGYADETFSARCWRRRGDKTWRFFQKLVDKVFFFDKNHCQTSYESERQLNHLPPELREG